MNLTIDNKTERIFKQRTDFVNNNDPISKEILRRVVSRNQATYKKILPYLNVLVETDNYGGVFSYHKPSGFKYQGVSEKKEKKTLFKKKKTKRTVFPRQEMIFDAGWDEVFDEDSYEELELEYTSHVEMNLSASHRKIRMIPSWNKENVVSDPWVLMKMVDKDCFPHSFSVFSMCGERPRFDYHASLYVTPQLFDLVEKLIYDSHGSKFGLNYDLSFLLTKRKIRNEISANKKYWIRKHQVCNNLYPPCHFDKLQYILSKNFDGKKLQKCGDVELNPGPTYEVSKLVCKKIMSGSELFSYFVLPNGFRFSVNVDKFEEQDEFFLFNVEENTRLNDEIFGKLNFKNMFLQNKVLKGSSVLNSGNEAVMRRTTRYTDHDNFKPDKRLTIQLISKLYNYIGSGVLMNNSEGHIVIKQNFCFIPKNLLKFRFSKQWYHYKEIEKNLHQLVSASVSRQTMTPKHMAEMASLLASLQMMTLDIKNNFDNLLSTFTLLFERNFHMFGKSQTCKFSPSDVWNQLFELETVFIPTTKIKDNDPVNVLRTASKVEGDIQFTLNEETLNDLATRTLKEYKFEDKTDEQIFKDFETGVLNVYAENIKGFVFHNNKPVYGCIQEQKPELTQEELMIKFLVNDRITEVDIWKTFLRTAHWAMKNCSSNQFRSFVKVCSKLRIDSFYQPGIFRVAKTVDEEIDDMEIFEFRHQKMDYINKKLTTERELSSLMQNEYFTWCKIFGIVSRKPVFNNFDFIFTLAKIRRTPVKTISDDVEEDEEPKGRIQQIYDKVKLPFQKGKEFFDSVVEGSISLKELNLKAIEMDNKYASLYDSAKNKDFFKSMITSDFNTIKGSFASVKLMINSLFSDLVTKVCGIFGVENDNQIDANKLLFYYIVWQHNDSKVLRFLMLVDIVIELGLLDYFWRVLNKIYDAFSSFFSSEPISDFDDFLKECDEKISKDREFVQTKVKEVEKETKELPYSESWIDVITQGLSIGTPLMLGAAATAFLASFGIPLTKMKYENVGELVVKSARNMGYLAIGLSALPKIFENIMKVLYFVHDYLKEKFVANHQSEYSYLREVEKWIMECIYLKGVSEKIFVQDLDSCLGFITHYNQMIKLRTDNYKIKDVNLRSEFNSRVQIMVELYPTVQSCIRIMLNQREIFHVQLYSEKPGVGKTDLSRQLIDMIAKSLREEENKLAATIGLKVKPPRTTDLDIYPLNDVLKHNDLYYGQHYGYVDEEGVNKNVDPDTVVQKMQLCSGFPCISQQAALTDKGRVFELKVLVSNTNNPWLVPDGMLKPQALWRRRELFEVICNPIYLTEGKIDENKIQAAGVNRTLGEHLLVTWRDNINNQVRKASHFENMTVENFLKLINKLSKLQYNREEKRLWIKDPTKSLVRIRYEQLKDDLLDLYAQKLVKDHNLYSLEKDLETLRNLVKTTDTKVKGEELFKDYARISRFCTQDNFEASKFIKTQCEPISFMDYGDGMYLSWSLESVELTSGKSWILKKNSNVNERSYSCPGEVDFSKFYILKRSGCQNIIAYRSENLSERERQSVQWYLLELSMAKNENDFNDLIKVKLSKQKGGKVWNEILAKLNIVRRRSFDFSLGILRWISNGVKNFISGPILSGICVGFSVMAAFFTLSIVGQILAPQPISYSNKERKQTFRIPSTRTVPISATIENSDIELAKNATYQFECNRERATMVGLKGSCFLVNKHALKVDKPTNIKVYDPKLGAVDQSSAFKIFEISPKDISEIPGADALVLHIKGFRPVRSVLKHFISEEDCSDDLINFQYLQAQVILLRLKDPKCFEGHREWKLTASGEAFVDRVYNQKAQWHHDRVLYYSSDIPFQKGDSGSLVIHHNNKISEKFLGIMLSRQFDISTSNSGFIGIITRQMLEKAIKKFPIEARIETVPKDGFVVPISHELSPVFKYNDEVYESPFQSQAISRSLGFKKSIIHGVFPVETHPAIQDVRDVRVPEGARHFLEISLNKTNGEKDPYFTQLEEKFMCNYLNSLYIKYVNGVSHVRIFNVNQAIIGIKSMGSTAINTKTCAGLPYKLEKGVVGKKPFIGFNERTKTWQIQDRVYSEVDIYKQTYLAGHIPHNYKLEFRKKELVPIEKIINPKTRTVATGNFIHQIIYNQLFKNLHTMVKNEWELGNSTPWALGVDPERHWTQVVEHLKFIDYVIDFDVKAWEEKMNLKLLLMTSKVKLDLIKRAYQSRGEVVPKDIDELAYGLAVDFTDCEVIFEDVMYRKRAGLLSGHPGTFMENSEVHEMILGLICFRILSKFRPSWATIDFISEHVRSIKAADDILIAISPLARTIITVEKLVEGYKELTFDVTSADKISEIRAKNILETQFLKQHFRFEQGCYFPVPNRSIIYQLFNWVRDDTDLSIEEQFKTNIENAFRFLFWRGEEEYEEIRFRANLALQKFHIHWSYDYAEMASVMRQQIRDAEEKAYRLNSVDDFDFDF